MKTVKLDYFDSSEVFAKSKPYIHAKDCYGNIFRVATNFIDKFRTGKWKVAYGYMSIAKGIYCRHCFILNEQRNVIDPTLFLLEPKERPEYLLMFSFERFDIYFDAIQRERYYPALINYLKEHDVLARSEANEKNIILID